MHTLVEVSRSLQFIIAVPDKPTIYSSMATGSVLMGATWQRRTGAWVMVERQLGQGHSSANIFLAQSEQQMWPHGREEKT